MLPEKFYILIFSYFYSVGRYLRLRQCFNFFYDFTFKNSVLHYQFLYKTQGLTLFLFNFFKGLSYLHLEITLPFAKLCYTFEEKLL